MSAETNTETTPRESTRTLLPEPSGKEHMTNGKKLLVAIITFLAVTAGSLLASAEEVGTPSAEKVQGEVDQPPSISEPSVGSLVSEALTEVSVFLTTPPAPPKATSTDGRWDRLAQCEAGGNWDHPPVSGGFSGGIMFHIGTWRAMGGEEFAPDAYLATKEQQIIVAERVLASSGWGAWPGCSRMFGWL